MIINLNQIILIIEDNIELIEIKQNIINYILTLKDLISIELFKDKLKLYFLRNIKYKLIDIYLFNQINKDIIPYKLLFNTNSNSILDIYTIKIELKNIKHNINIDQILNLIIKMLEYPEINKNYNDLILINNDNFIIDGKYNYIKSCLFNFNNLLVYKTNNNDKTNNNNKTNNNDKKKLIDILNQFNSFDLFIKSNIIVQEWIKEKELKLEKYLLNDYIRSIIITNLINNGLIQ